MSVITSRHPVSRRNASIPEVVVGTLLTLAALLTVQMAALTAWVDTFGSPGGFGRDQVDRLGRPLSGWSQTWQEFGPLLWAVYAVALLGVVAWLWRAILTKQPRAAWAVVTVLVAATAVFWVFNLDRFYAS
jgi:hypothetical protein